VALLARRVSHLTGVALSATSIAAALDRLAAAGLPDGRATFFVGDAAGIPAHAAMALQDVASGNLRAPSTHS